MTKLKKKVLSLLLTWVVIASSIFSSMSMSIDAKAIENIKPQITFSKFLPVYNAGQKERVSFVSKNVSTVQYYISVYNEKTNQMNHITKDWVNSTGAKGYSVELPSEVGEYKLIVRAKRPGTKYTAQTTNIRSIPFKVQDKSKEPVAVINPTNLSKEKGVYGGTIKQAKTYSTDMRISGKGILFANSIVSKDLYIDSTDVILSKVEVKGTIYLDPGDNGSATLEGVTAKEIKVLSGAQHSIHLNNTKSDVIVIASKNLTRIETNRGTDVKQLVIVSDAILDARDGRIESISVIKSLNDDIDNSNDGVDLEIRGKLAAPVEFKRNGSIKVTDGSIVEKINVTPAEKSSVKLDGNFNSVEISKAADIVLSEATKVTDSLKVLAQADITVKKGAYITKTDIAPVEKSAINLTGEFKAVEVNEAAQVQLGIQSTVETFRANVAAEIKIDSTAQILQVQNSSGQVLGTNVTTREVKIEQSGTATYVSSTTPIVIYTSETSRESSTSNVETETEEKIINAAMVDGYPKIASTTGSSITVSVKLNKPGKVYYKIIEGVVNASPNKQEIISENNYINVTGTGEVTKVLSNLKAGADYVIQFVVDSATGNSYTQKTNTTSDQRGTGYTIGIPDIFDSRYSLAVGVEYEIPVYVSGNYVDSIPYSNANIKMTVEKPEGADVDIIAEYEEGNPLNVADIGFFGPPEGYAISKDYGRQIFFKSTFNQPGTYKIIFELVDVSSGNEVLATNLFTTNVDFEEGLSTNTHIQITGLVSEGKELTFAEGFNTPAYVIEINGDANKNHIINFKEGSGSSVPLTGDERGLVPIYINTLEYDQVPVILDYYDNKFKDESLSAYKEYLKGTVPIEDSSMPQNPIAYLKIAEDGMGLTLIDAAQYEVNKTETGMIIPGDFPLSVIMMNFTATEGEVKVLSYMTLLIYLEGTVPIEDTAP